MKKKNTLTLRLHPKQLDIYNDPKRYKVVCSGRRFGKALSLDTPILTFNRGWVTMEDIKADDYVFNHEGKPVKVLGKSPVITHERTFEVHFSDNTSIKAGENHLWFTRQIDNHGNLEYLKKELEERPDFNKLPLKTTLELFKEYQEKTVRVYKSHINIDYSNDLVKDGIKYREWKGKVYRVVPDHLREHEDKIINPNLYIDGHKPLQNISYPIEDEIKEYLDEIKYPQESIYYNLGIQLSPFCITHLVGKKLLKINQYYKYILTLAMQSSWSNKKDILHGLMDGAGKQKYSDKFAFKRTQSEKRVLYTLESSNFVIVNYLNTLLRSLGITPVVKMCPHELGDKYTFRFFSPLFNPFKNYVKKKWDSCDMRVSNLRNITKVVEVEKEPLQCIQVDSEEGDWLAGEQLITTHNSRFLLTNTISKAINYRGVYDKASPPVIGLIYPTLKQGRTVIWQGLTALLENNPNVSKIYKSDFRVALKGNRPDIYLRGVDDGGESLRGLKFYHVALDEMQDIPIGAWNDVIQPALIDTPNSSAIFCGTPKGKGTEFHKLFLNSETQEEWGSYHRTIFDNPFIPRKEIEKMRETMPDRLFRQECLASWETFEGQIFSELDRDRHLMNPNNFPNFKKVFAGIDFGDCNPFTIIVGWDGHCYYILDYWENPNNKVAIEQHVHNKETMRLIEKYYVSESYADPSRGGVILSLRRAGCPKLRAGYNKVSEGNSVVNTLLYQDRIKISTDCERVFDVFSAYHRRSKNNIIYDEPAKNQDDHACLTGETEIMTMDFWKQIKDIKVGDKIWTKSSGWEQVLETASYNSVAYDVYDLVTELYAFSVTMGHPFFSKKMTEKDLIYSDDLDGSYKPFNMLFKSTRKLPLLILDKYSGRERTVYNIKVANSPEYFVRVPSIVKDNGVLSHNCDSFRYIVATREHKNINRDLLKNQSIIEPVNIPLKKGVYQ